MSRIASRAFAALLLVLAGFGGVFAASPSQDALRRAVGPESWVYPLADYIDGAAVNIPFIATGSSAARTPANRAADVINIKDFGAKTDETTPASAAIQAAFNVVPIAGAEVYFPCGKYLLDAPITGNGHQVAITFAGDACVLFTQIHTGTAFTFPQGNVAWPVTVTGSARFYAGATTPSAGALNVSFPTVASWTRPTFTMTNKISCISDVASGTAPYAQSYTNCITLAGAWQPIVKAWIVGPPTGAPFLAGTSAVVLGENTMGTDIQNLFASGVDSAVSITGYTEGTILRNPTVVSANYGIKVGNGSVDATGAYSGSSGITPRAGLNGILLQVIGGNLSVVRSNIFADTVEEVITKGTLFYNFAGDGTNPYLGLVLYNSRIADIDGVFQGNASNQTNSKGVFLTGTTNYAKISGVVASVKTGIQATSGTTNNSAGMRMHAVPTWINDAGANSLSSNPAGGMALIKTMTAPGDDPFEFTNFGTGYNSLELRCSDILGSVAGQNFILQVGTGSPPTYHTSSYENAQIYNAGTATTPAGAGGTGQIGAGNLSLAWSVTATSGLMFAAQIEQPNGVDLKQIRTTYSGRHDTDDTLLSSSGSGVWTGAADPITGVRVLFSASGVIARGRCSLYGLVQ